ncbi:MAG: methyltransferase domain-containing protein [Candidatus Latescibacteria bacterium]|nr:methyltransferase domain-containing protein [Candidatus Latescibacterota bacterium]
MSLSSTPITLDALRFFRTSRGAELLTEAADLAGDELRASQVLRARFPADICRAALALVQLRQAAREKFSLADQMYFDREGLEMASREEISTYRATRFQPGQTVADLGCGIGGDLLGLAARCRVQAIDLDRVRLEMARLNLQAAGLGAALIQADLCRFPVRADAIFLDPARRHEGRRVRSGEDYSPPLSFVQELRRFTPAVAVKVAPGIDESELPGGCEVEFISAGQQCREAVLYFGPLASAERRATVLPGPHTLVGAPGTAVPVAPPGSFVYDPDPALVRSHLLDELARRLDAWKLDPQIAYLSSAHLVTSAFARAYRILSSMPFNLKRLRRFLAQEGMYAAEIKKRRFPIEPQELRHLLDLPTQGQGVTLILTRLADQPFVFICVSAGK